MDRVQESAVVEVDAVGTTIQDLTLTQEQLGYTVSGEVITIEVVDAARELARYQAENGEGPPGRLRHEPRSQHHPQSHHLGPDPHGHVGTSGDAPPTRLDGVAGQASMWAWDLGNRNFAPVNSKPPTPRLF